MTRLSTLCTSLALLTIVSGAVAGCATEPDDELADVESAEAGISGTTDGKADALTDTATVYRVRHDDRRCRFPICGGWWVSRLNFERTRCADGAWGPECYVGALDWMATGLEQATSSTRDGGPAGERLVLRGRFGHGSAGEFGDYATFEVTEAYRAIGEAAASGVFYFLHDNGLRCITTPCFSVHEAKVNSTRSRNLSDLRLDQVTASDEDLATAYAQLGSERIIAAGSNQRVRGGGVALVATQVFVRVKPLPSDPLACSTDEECGLTSFPDAVTTIDDCYCPTCPTPLATGASEANEASWNAVCAGTHRICPLRPCAAPPPVSCLAGGQCGFGDGAQP